MQAIFKSNMIDQIVSILISSLVPSYGMFYAVINLINAEKSDSVQAFYGKTP